MLVMLINIIAMWGVIPCDLVDRCHCGGELIQQTARCHVQDVYVRAEAKMLS